jgi:hypothetical protein
MIVRHLLWHLGIAAGVVAVLTAFGVAWATALPVGVMAGCVAMLFHGGHGGHRQHDHQARPPVMVQPNPDRVPHTTTDKGDAPCALRESSSLRGTSGL